MKNYVEKIEEPKQDLNLTLSELRSLIRLGIMLAKYQDVEI